MEPNTNQLSQLFEGLSATGVRTILWDEDDNLLHADPGMLEIYQNEEFNEQFGNIELTEGMSWREWTEQEIMLGIIQVPEGEDQESFLNKMEKERQGIRDRRSRELTFKNGVHVLSTDIRLKDGGLFTSFTDITEQKQKNKKLNALTEAMDKSSTGIWIFDKNEKLVFANEQVRSTASNAGFEPKVGMKYQDYLGLLVKAGVVSVPEGVTEDDFIKDRVAQRLEIIDVDITERKTARGTSLLTTTRLEDGGLVTVSSDISELKNSNERISLLSNAMDKSSAGIWVFDKQDRFVFGNAKFHENMAVGGITIEEGLEWSEYIARLINAGIVIPPNGVAKEDFIKERIKVRSSIREEEVLEAETNIATFRLSTNRLDDGGLVTISTDITDLRRQNEALERLSSAMQEVPNGMLLWDKDDKLVFVNKFVNQVQKRRGIRSYELGDTWIKIQKSMIKDGAIVIPDGKSEKEFLKEISSSRANLKGQQVRERTTSEGQQFLLTDARLGDGGLVTIVTDVTELKKQEAELQRLRTATDLSSVGSMIWDKDDRLIYANRFVKEHNKEVHGVEIEEGITYSDFARSLMDKGALVVPNDTTLDDFLEKQLKNRALITYQHDGESESQSFERQLGDKTFLSSMVRLQDGSLFQTFADITELKKHELELARLNTATDFSSVGTLIWDENDKLIYLNKIANEFMQKGFGFSAEIGIPYDAVARAQIRNNAFEKPTDMSEDQFVEHLKKQRREFVYDPNKEAVASTLERVVGAETYIFSYLRLKDGSLYQTFTDVTELKKRETELQQLTAALDYSPVGTMIWNADDSSFIKTGFHTRFRNKHLGRPLS